MNSKKIVFIVGPTAVGKSDVGLCLCAKIPGEIVSCDSMQIYREINIASNKPSREVLKKVPHHLIDILSVRDEFDVARYNELALAAIADIHRRGRIPIVVGGSGMYMQVLLDGIFQGGVKNESLRKDLKGQAHQYGNQFIYDKLKEEDPEAAQKIHPNDTRRIVRALEICLTERIPISELQKQRRGLWGAYDIRVFGLNCDREQLYERINRRVEQMFEKGLVEEIEKVREAPWSLTAKKIIGVQEVMGFLNKEYDLAQAKERMKLNTRRLAKRQLTWFRKEKRIQWIEVDVDDAPAKSAAGILSCMQDKDGPENS